MFNPTLFPSERVATWWVLKQLLVLMEEILHSVPISLLTNVSQVSWFSEFLQESQMLHVWNLYLHLATKFMVTVGKYSIHSAHMRIHRSRMAWNSAWCLENKILTEDKDPIPPLKQPPPHLNRIPTEGKSIVNTDGSEIRRSTVEVGSLSQYLQGISVTSQAV